METILLIAFIVELFITLYIIKHIAIKSECKNNNCNFVLSELRDFIKGLFINKNWFGIVLSVIIFILAIPAIILLLFIELILWLLVLVQVLWDFGNKKY